jgi:hypothetical protein
VSGRTAIQRHDAVRVDDTSQPPRFVLAVAEADHPLAWAAERLGCRAVPPLERASEARDAH